MSNLYKYNTVVNKDERVIDYNEVIKNRIDSAVKAKKHRKADEDGFINGLDATVVEPIEGEAVLEDAQNNPDAVTFSQTEAQEEYENIIAEANEEAQRILADADAQAQVLRNNAMKKGFDEGKFKAQAEYEEKIADMQMQLQEKEQQLQAEYEEKVKSIEPELADVILDVISHVTHAVSKDSHDIIIGLINDVLNNVDISHEYLVKVSMDDYDYVVSNQGKIYSSMTNDANIDIVQDASLKKNECIIETDTGVFNCSLDVEMENLIKSIKMLSCI